jgi:hypothetical protein
MKSAMPDLSTSDGELKDMDVRFEIGWAGKSVWEPCEHWVIRDVNSEESVTKWLADIEADIGVGSSVGDCATCPETGTEYEEVLMSLRGWPLFSGRCALYRTESNAWASWAGAFDIYRNRREGSLYWRIKPEVGEVTEDDGTSQGWRVYARLVIAPPL